MEIDNANDIDVVMNMYNLIEYTENYSQTCGCLQQYYRDQPVLNDDGNVIDFPVNNDTNLSIKYKKNINCKTENDGPKNTEIWVPLKCLSNFWRTLDMSLTNYEIYLILT